MNPQTQTRTGDGSSIATGTRPRRVVASFSTYGEAEQAVDYLSDQRFPVERTAIVGEGLKLVEQVTGRITYGRAALQGAVSGAFIGLLIGWLFAVFDWSDPVVASAWLIVDGLWFGAVVGAIFGLIMHAFTGGRRDFGSIAGMQADRYLVQVDEDLADEAARLLSQRTDSPQARDQRR